MTDAQLMQLEVWHGEQGWVAAWRDLPGLWQGETREDAILNAQEARMGVLDKAKRNELLIALREEYGRPLPHDPPSLEELLAAGEVLTALVLKGAPYTDRELELIRIAWSEGLRQGKELGASRPRQTSPIRLLTYRTDLVLARDYLRQGKLVLALMRMRAAVYGMLASR